jgi:BirA family transcriptional regulator, biotin operon repressor / biotin---[acetyl-CoA-carboxylase] ligase
MTGESDMLRDLMPDVFCPNERELIFPRTVRYYEQVGSTMDVAREWLQQSAPDDIPLLVVAEAQETGRGRQQRRWVVPVGSAVLFSLALRPAWLDPAHAPALIWMMGVAVCEAIAEATGLAPRLKWPNDVLLLPETNTPPAKVAGILLEAGSSQQRVEWAIIGCGINVNAAPPPDITPRYPTTCLAAALGRPLDRSLLLRGVLARLEHWYIALAGRERETLFARWRGLLHTIGQEVTIQTAEGVIAGIAEGVEPSGALRVRDGMGHLHTIANGDVG